MNSISNDNHSASLELNISDVYDLKSAIYVFRSFLGQKFKGVSSGPKEVKASLEILRRQNQLTGTHLRNLKPRQKLWVGSGSITNAVSMRILSSKPSQLILGPNLDIHNPHVSRLLREVDKSIFLVPSEWVRNYFVEILGQKSEKVIVWAAGVDTSKWKPQEKNQSGFVIYVKGDFDDTANSMLTVLRSQGYQGLIFKYGAYSQYRYREALSRASFAIFLVGTESQGIAQLQAWSCDVPSLVLEQNSFSPSPSSKAIVPASSSPYLTTMTGRFFNIEESSVAIDQFIGDLKTFEPRSWVIKNMSIEVSSANFLTLLK